MLMEVTTGTARPLPPSASVAETGGVAGGYSLASGELVWTRAEMAAGPPPAVRVLSGLLLATLVGEDALGESPLLLAGPGRVVDMGALGLGDADNRARLGLMALGPARVELVPEREVTRDVLCGLLQAQTEMLEWLGQLTMTARAARLLLKAAAAAPQPAGGIPEVRATQEHMALGLGYRRETFTAMLSGWVEDNIVQTRYRKVRLLDLPRLRELAKKGGR